MTAFSRPRWPLLVPPLIILTLVPFLIAPTPALAWGKPAHRVVATVATSLLTPEARAQVTDLLGARGCVVSAIEQSLRLLHDTSKDRAVREEALRWIVHFVADLHQPLHVVGEDRGGNDVIVQFMGRQTNLHRLWDGDLIDHVYPSATALYKSVQVVLQTATTQTWAEGRPADWAMETHRVAREAVSLFPASRVIDDRYVQKALPVIHERLAKVAVRLAGVLNQALGQP